MADKKYRDYITVLRLQWHIRKFIKVSAMQRGVSEDTICSAMIATIVSELYESLGLNFDSPPDVIWDRLRKEEAELSGSDHE